jgi:hypothetical protein
VPLVIPPRVRSALLRIAALTTCLVFAGAGAAFASCPAQSVGTPFSQWNDPNSYYLVPGGSFEGSVDDVGWSLDNASLSSGNEPFQVNSSSDIQSLTIQGGGSATSPYFCVDNTMTSLRFFGQQVDSGSDLQVDALVQKGHGVTDVPLADLADRSMPSWAPTDPIDGGSGSLSGARSIEVALRFTAPSSTGSWQVDDIYVDPYRSG